MIYFNVAVKGPPPGSFGVVGGLDDPGLNRELVAFAGKHNREMALRGLDKRGYPLRPWHRRFGVSDYHGREYRRWSNRTVLVPFGEGSRRVDDNTTWLDRTGVKSDGSGVLTLTNGFTGNSRGLPLGWKRDGRDVLGLDPEGLRGFRAILLRHGPRVVFAGHRSHP